MCCDCRGPEGKADSATIMRHVSVVGFGGVFFYPPNHAFLAPATLYGKSLGPLNNTLSRQCLWRNLPFLPDPCEAFTKYSIT